MSIQEQINLIQRGCSEIINIDELSKKLQSSANTGKKLIIKAGFDPTAPDIHLGHTVLLNKLKIFQDLGHTVYFLVGDFTARIGDPTGRNAMRPPITEEEIRNNSRTYQEQAFKILDPEKTKVVYNSDWLAKLNAADLIKLASMYTVARMLERDDFSNRYSTQQPIAIHEFLYPLLQGYDSVEIKADIEIGGNDQKFNLLMGRELQKQFSIAPQVVITVPLLEGTDGVRKMSKSYGNYIGIIDSPDEMFGKIMSISDELMWKYYDLLSHKQSYEIANLRSEMAQGKNPKDLKIILGVEIVSRFYDKDAADKAAANFHARFAKGLQPDVIPEHIADVTKLTVTNNSVPLSQLLKEAGLAASTSEAIRLIRQGAVKIDNVKVTNEKLFILLGTAATYQVGKRNFKKIILNK
ncbi:MAG: tyrosine--tRNA ligase [Gammaproteobacteria bacterium]|nr:tyrosine--tRNA ligase [Gammaproteobacteria bacterium]